MQEEPYVPAPTWDAGETGGLARVGSAFPVADPSRAPEATPARTATEAPPEDDRGLPYEAEMVRLRDLCHDHERPLPNTVQEALQLAIDLVAAGPGGAGPDRTALGRMERARDGARAERDRAIAARAEVEAATRVERAETRQIREDLAAVGVAPGEVARTLLSWRTMSSIDRQAVGKLRERTRVSEVRQEELTKANATAVAERQAAEAARYEADQTVSDVRASNTMLRAERAKLTRERDAALMQYASTFQLLTEAREDLGDVVPRLRAAEASLEARASRLGGVVSAREEL